MQADVAIVGGGPAGIAAALSLKQLAPNAHVTVFEAARSARWRPGETLAPPGRTILKSLGAWEAFQAEHFPESFGSRGVWGSDQPYENEFLFSVHGNGCHVDRERFDAMLVRCARRAGVEVREGELFTGSAGFVIDASGRRSVFATAKGAVRQLADALVGVFAVLETTKTLDTYTQVEAQSDGWWYSAPLGESKAIVAWMSDADLVREGRLREPACWSAQLAKARFTSDRLRGALPEHVPRIHAAQSQRIHPIAGPGWIAAGDAAMTFDPLSSQGIVKALRSGKLASYVAFDHLQGCAPSHVRYERMVQHEYETYDRARRQFYSTETRWPESPFWLRRR